MRKKKQMRIDFGFLLVGMHVKSMKNVLKDKQIILIYLIIIHKRLLKTQIGHDIKNLYFNRPIQEAHGIRG